MNKTFCVTGIGTGVGKTLLCAILAEALNADYWKPVQAGFEDGTDSDFIRDLISGSRSVIHPESYILKMPASPHIAARDEQIRIEPEKILSDFQAIRKASENNLIVEGAGGLLVPINEKQTMLDLFRMIGAEVIIVSRNYLGSINHSLLTAHALKHQGLPVAGWVFNDQYLNYEEEIAGWTQLPILASIPYTAKVDSEFVKRQAEYIRPVLYDKLGLLNEENKPA